MPYSNLNLIPTYASIILISSLLLGGSFLMISAYADDDEDEDYKDDIDQDVKQNKNVKSAYLVIRKIQSLQLSGTMQPASTK